MLVKNMPDFSYGFDLESGAWHRVGGGAVAINRDGVLTFFLRTEFNRLLGSVRVDLDQAARQTFVNYFAVEQRDELTGEAK